MLFLEQDIIRKEQVDKKLKFEAKELDLEVNNNVEYEVKAICNSAIYIKKSKISQLLRFYYLISRKDYSEEKSTWKSSSIVQYLKKFISTFYKEHLNKLTAILTPIDIVLLMAQSITKANISSKLLR